uniref:Uncharacterized protein n=1 Tax=Meloidogyne javanica TaxID=6303 RepID=A0A915MGR6_MELJA
MSLLPMFYAKIDFEVNKLSDEIIANAFRFPDLRYSITIATYKTKVDDIEDGQMNVYNKGYYDRYPDAEFVGSIYPLINEGSYEFYLDEDGITSERMKFVKANNKIVNFKKESP